MTDFNALGLAEPLLKALNDLGYSTPTPIQRDTIPALLEGHDLLGLAQTGTGKTAAFSLPMLQKLSNTAGRLPRRGIRALILAPTRELASQIEESIRDYGKYLRLSSRTAFGGVPIHKQISALANGLDILVATPGRLLDLVERDAVFFDFVEVLVVDEADQMMDMGFIQPLRKIVALLPKNRQTLFFSATMPKEIRSLADAMLKAPVEVSVAPSATPAERIQQSVIHIDHARKAVLLRHLLDDVAMQRVIVFAKTKHGADRVVKVLERMGVPSAAIHGNRSQAQRERALEGFRRGAIRLLIATDIAARGIDVDNISHVINYDLPNVPETYVHRIGRTARAGAEGEAISFCTPDERPYLRQIEKTIKRRLDERANPLGDKSAADIAAERNDKPLNEGETLSALDAARQEAKSKMRFDRRREGTEPNRPRKSGFGPRREREESFSRPRRDDRMKSANPRASAADGGRLGAETEAHISSLVGRATGDKAYAGKDGAARKGREGEPKRGEADQRGRRDRFERDTRPERPTHKDKPFGAKREERPARDNWSPLGDKRQEPRQPREESRDKRSEGAGRGKPAYGKPGSFNDRFGVKKKRAKSFSPTPNRGRLAD